VALTPPGRNFFVDIKTTIVKGLIAAFDDIDYPDPQIKGINISMEYPMEQNQYPHIWVQFSITKSQQMGLGHVIYEDGILKQQFIFYGTVTLHIVALSSLARDIIASQLFQMLAFRDLNPIAAKFNDYLKQDQFTHMTFDRDTLQPQGQSVNVGTPWGSDELVYDDGYSFQVVGQIDSTFNITPEFLKKIVLDSTDLLSNSTTVTEFGQDYTPPAIDLGSWQ
jgi:hypothetical protein